MTTESTFDVHWTLGLLNYSEDAASTLPAQLDLLKTLADLGDEKIALIMRIATAQYERDSDLAAQCQILCASPTGAVVDERSVNSLKNYAAIGLLAGYGITHGKRPHPIGDHHLLLTPHIPQAAVLPIKRDWALLIDLLRRQENNPMAVDVVCSLVPNSATPGTRYLAPHQGTPVVVSSDEGAEFLTSISESREVSPHALAMSVTVHSTEPIDDALAMIIGRVVLGVGVRPNRRELANLVPVSADTALIGQPEEILRAWHAPYGDIQGRGITRRGTEIPIKVLPKETEGACLGTANYQSAVYDREVEVKVSWRDRLRHVYVLGKTGSGKTNLLKNLALHDIEAGQGCAVITPHPDLTSYLAERVGEREQDVISLDFSDPDYAPGLNPLTMDIKDDGEYMRAADELLEILMRRSFNQFTGPVFEDLARQMFTTVRRLKYDGVTAAPTITLASEILRSADGRKWIASQLKETDPELHEQWKNFNEMMPSTVAEQTKWVLAKFTDFGEGGGLRGITSGVLSPLSIQGIYDDRKILLVTIPETSMGSSAAQFVGSFVFSRLYRAARSQIGLSPMPFFVHVDEFQRFVSYEIESLVAEARKFGLGLSFAHQNLKQLEAFSRYEGASNHRLSETIFSNVGTMVAMKTSGRDVATIATEFEIKERQVRDIRQYEGLARCVINGQEAPAFTLQIPDAADREGDPASAARIRERMIDEGIWTLRKEQLEEAERITAAHREAVRPPLPRRAQKATPPLEPADHKTAGGSTFLDEWLEKRREAGQAKASTPDRGNISDTPARGNKATSSQPKSLAPSTAQRSRPESFDPDVPFEDWLSEKTQGGDDSAGEKKRRPETQSTDQNK